MLVLSKLLLPWRAGFCLALGITALVTSAAAEESETVYLLELLRPSLESFEIEVYENLNARDIARGRPEKPRLGGFVDLPLGRLPLSSEIQLWEADYEAKKIAGIALLECNECRGALDDSEFLTYWLESPHSRRGFLSYSSGSESAALPIVDAARQAGLSIRHLTGNEIAFAAELFATGGLRLGLDTRESRSAKSELAEISLLGQRTRRNSNSVFRDSDRQWGRGVSKNEPANFIKESLGGEFTQSTIREVIVPGGVALGETAKLRQGISAFKFDGNELLLVDENKKQWNLPALDSATAKALFDFVQRSEQLKSDAIVDIDAQSKVRISSALRDTDAGWEIMHADTLPFKFVRNLNVSKSVIVDTFVRWSAADDSSLTFDSEYEVRFLSADNMRIAQTRAALVYEYDAQTGRSEFKDTWGRDERRLKENLDTEGLGNNLSEVAVYSGWVALFRSVIENNVNFLEGRYQFMKIDTSGRKTPARY